MNVTDFASICALREGRKKPEVLSVCVLIFSCQKGELYFHRRSIRSATYPGFLHTFGGAIILDQKKGNNVSIDLTHAGAKSDVLEKTQLKFRKKGVRVLALKELSTGFIQFALVGINLNTSEAKQVKMNLEGNVVTVPFGELGTVLLSKKRGWVPTGKAQVLSWLAMGAPNCAQDKAVFGFANKSDRLYSAQELFGQVLSKL